MLNLQLSLPPPSINGMLWLVKVEILYLFLWTFFTVPKEIVGLSYYCLKEE